MEAERLVVKRLMDEGGCNLVEYDSGYLQNANR